MGFARHIMRIAGAVIVFAVLALAPSVAKAHSGHSHAPAMVQQEAPAPAKVDQPGSVQTAAQEKAPELASLARPDSMPATKGGCTGSCCKSAMACCVAFFAESGESLAPPGVVTRLDFPSSDSWTSLTPDRLQRPPKSFA
jgi:hypothetical protein